MTFSNSNYSHIGLRLFFSFMPKARRWDVPKPIFFFFVFNFLFSFLTTWINCYCCCYWPCWFPRIKKMLLFKIEEKTVVVSSNGKNIFFITLHNSVRIYNIEHQWKINYSVKSIWKTVKSWFNLILRNLVTFDRNMKVLAVILTMCLITVAHSQVIEMFWLMTINQR